MRDRRAGPRSRASQKQRDATMMMMMMLMVSGALISVRTGECARESRAATLERRPPEHAVVNHGRNGLARPRQLMLF